MRQLTRRQDFAAARGYTDDDLVDDYVAVITSRAARISGRRNSKRRTEHIKSCIEHVMQEKEEGE